MKTRASNYVVGTGLFLASFCLSERVAWAEPAAPDSSSIFAELKKNAALIKNVIKAAPDYERKLAELRAKRAQPCPVATGYDERAAQSADGRADLQRKSAEYERITQMHLVGFTVMKPADIDPASHEVLRFPFEVADSAYHSGQLLAARAYKYGVTRSAIDLTALRESVLGVYNLMTIARASKGRLFDRTGRRVSSRVGLPVRGYAAEDDPRFEGNRDLKPTDARTYIYEGSLRGLPQTRFVVVADVSIDQVDGLLLGMTAAYEVLAKTGSEPELRRLIGEAVGEFVRAFIANGYKIIDLTGRTTKYGDASGMEAPNVLIQNLAYLRAGVVTTQAADIKAAYKKLADKYLGGFAGVRGAIFKTELDALETLVREFKEPIQYSVSDFNYNLLMLPLHVLTRHETDSYLRGIFRHYAEHFARPLTENLAVPFFDGVYLSATGRRDAPVIARMAAILRQYRNPPPPFGNPASATEYMTDFSTRKELRDPLFDYLHGLWDKNLSERNSDQKNPFRVGGGIWRLGPGLVPRDNNIERANPYALSGYETTGTRVGSSSTLRRFSGHDYLLSYWFARYHGFL